MKDLSVGCLVRFDLSSLVLSSLDFIRRGFPCLVLHGLGFTRAEFYSAEFHPTGVVFNRGSPGSGCGATFWRARLGTPRQARRLGPFATVFAVRAAFLAALWEGQHIFSVA